jgi:uncharacterized membrane protein YcaP (DUF421 family)
MTLADSQVYYIFESWPHVLHAMVMGVLVYVGMVLAVRSFGHRSLSKMSAFDFVVTVSIGSAMGSAVTSRDVTVLEAMAAVVTLLLMQFIMAEVCGRWRKLEIHIKGRPVLIVYNGKCVEQAMRRESVSQQDVLTAARGEGAASLAEVHAMVLETDGSFSVIQHPPERPQSTLEPAIENAKTQGDDLV